MLSMKYIDGNGVEWIEGGFVRTRCKISDGGRVVEGDRTDGSTHAFFQDTKEPDPENPPMTCPRLYIMNETGTTLSTYNMGPERVAPRAAE